MQSSDKNYNEHMNFKGRRFAQNAWMVIKYLCEKLMEITCLS